MKPAAFLAAALLTAPAFAADRTAVLQSRIAEAVHAFRGDMGVAVINLDTGESVAVNGDQRFPTASLVKVAVMVEVFNQIAEGKLRPEQTLTLRNEDKAGDETVPLNVMHPGSVLTVADLLRFMIAWSDNTATNLLVRLVGTANVDKRLESYGLTEMKLFRPTFRDGRADVFPELEREYGLGMTTPNAAAKLFALIAQGRIVSRAACDEMISILALQQDRAMIPRSLPLDDGKVLVANKTGWDEEKLPDASGFKGDVRNDAAYVKSPGARYVIAICARRIKDKRSSVDNETFVTGAAISRMVFDFFNPAAH
ncbi:MAG TPA: serine hydrolase [Thermoanaerobaculia bacterium]|nr:serine hydrolase [Thermoanaerobaculia bacterium]